MIKRKLTNIYIIIIIILIVFGLMMGLYSTKFSTSVFGIYSKYPIVDSIKIIFIIILSALLLYFISHQVSKKLVTLIIVAFTLRIIMILIMSFFGFLPYQFDNNWDVAASILLPDWRAGNYHFDINNTDITLYSKITVVVYYFLGENPIYMQLLNAFFSVLTVYYLFKLGNYLSNKKVAYRTAWMISLWPTYIFFSSMHMKEALAIYFIITFAYYFVKWLRKFKIKYLIITFILLILSSLIRPQNAVLMMLVILPIVLYYVWVYTNKYLKVIILFLALTFGATAFLILKVTGYLDYFSIDYISREMSYRTHGGSGYLYWMNYNSVIDIVIYSPIRLFYFLYTPFPWQIKDISQVFAFLEAVFLIGISLYILKYFKRFWRNYTYKKELFFIIYFCFIGLTANAVIDANVGTAIRHKLQYLFIFFVLFNVIQYQIKKTKTKLKT